MLKNRRQAGVTTAKMNELIPSNKTTIKQANTSLILRVIREAKTISRAEISKMTGLNPATVSSRLVELIEFGLVREKGTGESSGGRKPTLLELNADEFAVIAIDMGTTEIHAALVNLEGKADGKMSFPLAPPYRPDSVISTMVDAAEAVLAKVGKKVALGIGIGAHGLVDSGSGTSIYAPAFQWHDVPLAEKFEQLFQLPVRVDNDVRAMAAAEKWFGKAKSLSHFLFLNIGTGIGSGIYMNGELLRGARYGAGEIGHVHIVDEAIGPRCFCGSEGCLSTVASGPALETRFKKRLQQGARSLLADREAEITGQLIYEAALQGDQLSQDMLHETGVYIGQALSGAVNLLNPEMIIIGGGLSRAEKFLFPAIRQTIQERAMQSHAKHLKVVRTALGDDSGLAGAATLIISELFQQPEQFLQMKKIRRGNER